MSFTAEQLSIIGQWLAILSDTGPQRDGEPYATFTLTENTRGKYSRVVGTLGGQDSVHAFVDTAGNVYKSAGWKAPAKGVRYTLADSETLLRNASGGWAGGYLYANRQQTASIIG
jgi:hypothetical protein